MVKEGNIIYHWKINCVEAFPESLKRYTAKYNMTLNMGHLRKEIWSSHVTMNHIKIGNSIVIFIKISDMEFSYYTLSWQCVWLHRVTESTIYYVPILACTYRSNINHINPTPALSLILKSYYSLTNIDRRNITHNAYILCNTTKLELSTLNTLFSVTCSSLLLILFLKFLIYFL